VPTGFTRRLEKAARSLLHRRFPAAEAREILELARRHYREAAAALPREQTFGARAMLGVAAFDVGLYRALTEKGIQAQEAFEFAADTNWDVFRRSTARLDRLIGLFVREPLRASAVYSRLTHRFFFKPPGWRREEVQVEGGYGMDMHRCPISDYLRSLGLGELCERAICDVDRRQRS
jgi:hypothetical protein